MCRKILLLLCLLVRGEIAFSQNSWKLSTEKEGIKIYTRPVANSKIKAIKVECKLEAKQEQLVALILDIDNSNQWVYHSKVNRVVKRVSPLDLYYYAEVNVPWPAANREYVSHIMVSQNPKTKVITVDAPCVTGMVAPTDKVIRITHSIGKWVIDPPENNTIQVSYELEVDPAGTTPAWLVNLFATQGPLETFQKLKQQLLKPEYKSARIPLLLQM